MELLGPEAWQHRDELQEVKRQIGVKHDKFDCWIFKFLENKHFDIEETVAKLQRRAEMERQFLDYEITAHMKEMMRSGIMQIIGEDLEGRVTLYVVTKRDFPKSELREERKRNVDMWLSYASRLRLGEPRCRVTMLINQKDASAWYNSDMTFQTNIAIRFSKFFPGMIDRAYVCCMGGALGAVARPIIKAMPRVISDKIFIYNEKQVFKENILHQYFEPSMIPIDLGGTNDCDHPENWESFATNVETYFGNVKAAISRGLSIKEYELSVIEEEERKIAEEARAIKEKRRQEEIAAYEQSAEQLASSFGALPSGMRRRRHHATASDLGTVDPETVSLVTADSGDDSLATPNHTPRLRPSYPHAYEGSSLGRQLMLLEVARRVEEMEEWLRSSIADQQTLHLEELSKLYLSATTRLRVARGEQEAGDHSAGLAMRCPAPARSVTRGTLMILSVLMTIFFVAATIFVILSGAAIMVVMFLSIFINSYNMYPLGLGVLIVGHQCGLIGSRGFELVRNAFKGQLIRPLKAIPNMRHGLVIQFVGFIIIVVAAAAVFVTYSSLDSPLSGTRYAIGTGMYACAIVIGLYHAGFPLGIFPEEKTNRDRGFGLHLIFDIDEVSASSNRSLTSTIVVTSIPALFALLFGISFMVQPSLVFIIAVIATALASAFAINSFVRGNFTNVNGNLLRATTWVAMIYWVVISFIIGFANLPEFLKPELIASTIIVAYFIFLTMMCYYLSGSKKAHRVAFRWSYGSYALFLLIGVILTFIVHWAFGLVMTLLLVHGVASFMRPKSTAMIGSLVTVLVMLFVGLTVVLYAFQTVSFSDYDVTVKARLEHVPRPRYKPPICLPTWGAGSATDPNADPNILLVTDFALLGALSYHQNTTRLRADLGMLFPSFNLTTTVSMEGGMVLLRVYESSGPDVTVISLSPGTDRLAAMQALAMWGEAIALQPYGLVLPRNWTAQIVSSVSFLTQLFPLPYKTMLNDVRGRVEAIARNAANNSRMVVLTGHSYGGGIAAVTGALLQLPTITFDAPGALLSKYKFDMSEWNYVQFVTSIVSDTTALGNVDDAGATQQSWSCRDDIVTCSKARTAFCMLQRLCGSHVNRSLDYCHNAPSTIPPVPSRSRR